MVANLERWKRSSRSRARWDLSWTSERSFRSIRRVCLQLRRVPRRPEAELFAVARLHPGSRSVFAPKRVGGGGGGGGGGEKERAACRGPDYRILYVIRFIIPCSMSRQKQRGNALKLL